MIENLLKYWFIYVLVVDVCCNILDGINFLFFSYGIEYNLENGCMFVVVFIMYELL